MPDLSLCRRPLLIPHALLRLQAVQARPKQPTACDFACYIVSACIVREPILAASDLLHTLDALSKLARTLAQPNSMQLMSLVEQARRPRWVPAPFPRPLPCRQPSQRLKVYLDAMTSREEQSRLRLASCSRVKECDALAQDR